MPLITSAVDTTPYPLINTDLLEVLLLCVLVLDDRDCSRARLHPNDTLCLQISQDVTIHVLDLHGQHIAQRRKLTDTRIIEQHSHNSNNKPRASIKGVMTIKTTLQTSIQLHSLY